jgi:hypothetical protein
MSGANMYAAQLQGADLEAASLQGASLEKARIWRVYGTPAPNIEQTNLEGCDPDEKPWSDQGTGPRSFTEWRDLVLKGVPAGERDQAKARLSALDPSAGQEPHHVIDPKLCTSASRKGEEWDKELAVFLAGLACTDSISASNVARGLLENGRIRSVGSQIVTIAERWRKGKLDPTSCLGVGGFTDEDWAKLDELTRRAPKPEQRVPGD